MQLTNHAAKRCQQRALPFPVIELIMKLGKEVHSNRGCKIKILNTKALKREFLGELEYLGLKKRSKWCEVYLVVSADEWVITAGYRYKKLNNKIH